MHVFKLKKAGLSHLPQQYDHKKHKLQMKSHMTICHANFCFSYNFIWAILSCVCANEDFFFSVNLLFNSNSITKVLSLLMYTSNFKVLSQPINETEKNVYIWKSRNRQNNGARARCSTAECLIQA